MLIGGPATAVEFAKVGAALGVQTAVATKAGDVADSAINSVGRKVDVAIDKTGESVQNFMNVASVSLQLIADTWSKVFLCGYALKKSLESTDYAMDIYSKHCTSIFQNLNCTSLSFTNTSLNVTTVLIGMILAKKIYNITLSDKK